MPQKNFLSQHVIVLHHQSQRRRDNFRRIPILAGFHANPDLILGLW